jgi:hypothetical protein
VPARTSQASTSQAGDGQAGDGQAGDGRAYSVLVDHVLLGGATSVASAAADLQATAVAWGGTVAIAARRADVAADTSLRVLAVVS